MQLIAGLTPTARTLCLTLTFVLAACEQSIPELSHEQLEDQAELDQCASLFYKGGAKLSDGLSVLEKCRSAQSTRPKRAFLEIRQALIDTHAFTPDAVGMVPLGPCHDLIQKYVGLQERIYRINEGKERARLVAESEHLLGVARTGSCPS